MYILGFKNEFLVRNRPVHSIKTFRAMLQSVSRQYDLLPNSRWSNYDKWGLGGFTYVMKYKVYFGPIEPCTVQQPRLLRDFASSACNRALVLSNTIILFVSPY